MRNRIYVQGTCLLELDRTVTDQDYEILLAAEVLKIPVRIVHQVSPGRFDIAIGPNRIRNLSWLYLKGYKAPPFAITGQLCAQCA